MGQVQINLSQSFAASATSSGENYESPRSHRLCRFKQSVMEANTKKKKCSDCTLEGRWMVILFSPTSYVFLVSHVDKRDIKKHVIKQTSANLLAREFKFFFLCLHVQNIKHAYACFGCKFDLRATTESPKSPIFSFLASGRRSL